MKKKILDNVIKLRIKANLSQEQMADLMNITQSRYARFERGAIKTDLDMLLLFCSKLNIDFLDLITYPEKISVSPATKTDVTIQIKLPADKKDQVLKLIFGSDVSKLLGEK